MSGWRQARTAQQKFPRRATCVAVRISTVDPEIDPDSGEPFFRSTEATTANVSRGGVFVHSWEPLAAGRRVIVALDLPAGGELSLFGQVAWTRRRLESGRAGSLETPGYGIEFVGVTRAEQAAIQQILDAPGATPAPAGLASTASPHPTASCPSPANGPNGSAPVPATATPSGTPSPAAIRATFSSVR